jgi:MoxR-like ATPase
LPEAQRDRFFARTAIGYPDPANEVAMLADRETADPMDELTEVASTEVVDDMIGAVNRIHIAPALRQYIVSIVGATRGMPQVRLGCSPRAVLHLGRAAKAAAALSGRSYVIPDDIQHLAIPVLAHRLLLTVEAHAANRSAESVVAEILAHTRVPLGLGG